MFEKAQLAANKQLGVILSTSLELSVRFAHDWRICIKKWGGSWNWKKKFLLKMKPRSANDWNDMLNYVPQILSTLSSH